jgi:acetyl-CoA acetyltransferase
MMVCDFDVIELNEAFAFGAGGAAPAACRRRGERQSNGGAIALGHPLGASGGRLMITALNQLEATGGKRALCSMCIGVGRASPSRWSGPNLR